MTMMKINPKGINKHVYDSTCKKPDLDQMGRKRTTQKTDENPKKCPQHEAESSSTETSVINSHREFEVRGFWVTKWDVADESST
jgi:hypothetical protein